MSPLTLPRPLAILASALLLAGCTTLQPQDFAKSDTRFELDRFFTGHNRSWGVFENRDGAPRLTFTCDNVGARDAAGDVTLTQHFQFSNGTRQTRIWKIHRLDATHWQATANDMIGTAVGEGQGNAFRCEYNIQTDPKNSLSAVHIRQWMYQPEGTADLMTRLVITKLGVTIAEVSEVIHPVP
jgi:hypothetical protein